MKLRAIILVLPILFNLSCKEAEQQAAKPPQIKVVEVLKKDIPIYNYFVGEVFGEEDVSINARVEGYLTGILFLTSNLMQCEILTPPSNFTPSQPVSFKIFFAFLRASFAEAS